MNNPDTMKQIVNLMERRIIGQERPISVISNEIRKKSSRREHRPLSFLLLGASGTGKTLISETLSKILIGSGGRLVRIDFQKCPKSYQSRHGIFAPPQHSEFGLARLTILRQDPTSIVLFENCESMPQAGQKILWRALQNGDLTVNEGEKIDCSKAIFIFTSRIGSEHIPSGKVDTDALLTGNQMVRQGVRARLDHFLYDSIGSIIILNKLSQSDLLEIFDVRMANLKLSFGQILNFDISNATRLQICQRAFKEDIGAHPLLRMFQTIVDQVNDMLFDGALKAGDTVQVIREAEDESVYVGKLQVKVEDKIEVITPPTSISDRYGGQIGENNRERRWDPLGPYTNARQDCSLDEESGESDLEKTTIRIVREFLKKDLQDGESISIDLYKGTVERKRKRQDDSYSELL